MNLKAIFSFLSEYWLNTRSSNNHFLIDEREMLACFCVDKIEACVPTHCNERECFFMERGNRECIAFKIVRRVSVSDKDHCLPIMD